MGVFTTLNPNIQALVSAACFALVLIFFVRVNSKGYVYWVLLAIFTGINLYLQSVTGLLSVFAVFCYAKYELVRGKKKYLLLCFTALLLLVLNMPSVKGRMHILNISSKAIAGRFPHNAASYAYIYNHNQIEYFRQNGLGSRAAYVADEGGYALNDVLQMIILHGLPGLIVMLSLYSVFLFALWTSRKQAGIKLYLLPLLPYYIFIPFSYPLQLPLLAFCFIILHLPLLFYFSRVNGHVKFARAVRLLLIILAPVFTVAFIIQSQSNGLYQSKMNKAIDTWGAGFHNDALGQLEKLDEQLCRDKKFIYHKAKYMHLSDRNNKAVLFLSAHHEHGCGYDYHILSGDVYNELGALLHAANEYKNALYLVPQKLESRYKLMQLYNNMGKKDSAIYYARQLLNTRLKTYNPKSEYYKNAATSILCKRSVSLQ